MDAEKEFIKALLTESKSIGNLHLSLREIYDEVSSGLPHEVLISVPFRRMRAAMARARASVLPCNFHFYSSWIKRNGGNGS